MDNKHDISTYSKLAEAAIFYLDESFNYINKALEAELCRIIFFEKIKSINPSPHDRQIVAAFKIPTDTISFLQNNFEEVLKTETLSKLTLAWNQAQIDAKNTPHIFHKSHTINSIELLGHLNNFAFFIETLTNRHLLFLKHTQKLDNFSYNQLSLSKILIRLIFICKEELDRNEIQLNEIANLFTHRNKTVHYTPDNATTLQIDIASLIRIWKQTIKFLTVLHAKEKFNEDKFSLSLNEHIKRFESQWAKKNKSH